MVLSALWLSVLTSFSAFAAADTKKIRLAYAGWDIGTAVAYVGVDTGLFKKQQLEIEEILIRDTLSAGVHGLLGIDMLIGFGQPLAIMQPILGGADVSFVGSHVSIEHYGMGVTADVSEIKDLKGKKIGVSGLGGRSDLIARVIIRRAGLDPVKDVQVVAVGLSPQRAIAVSKNLIQGSPLSAEVASEAKKLGIKILDTKAVPVVRDLILTTRSFIRKDEDTVRRFIRGYATAIHHFLTRPDETKAILKKYVSGTQGISLEAMYDAFSTQLRPLPELNAEAIQALVDVAAVVDQRSKSLKPGDVVEPRFIEELKGSKFLKDLYTEKVSL